MSTVDDLHEWARAIETLAREAGTAILEVYAETDQGVREKADRTPVTEADLRAEALILEGLRRLTPDIPIVAEESVAAGRIPEQHGVRFWLVDPLDGTREFLSRNGEFTVNIALIDRGVPVLGVVHAPAIATTYVGGPDGAYVERENVRTRIRTTAPDADGMRVVVSRSHLDAETEKWLETVKVKAYAPAGSSLKFCTVAEGSADLYPRLQQIMEWDIAAGHAVLVAAGGRVRTLDGALVVYGAPDFRAPKFVADGGPHPAG